MVYFDHILHTNACQHYLTTDMCNKEGQQGSGIDTIMYHSCPRIPSGKAKNHNKHNKQEPRGQPFHFR